MTMSGAVVRLVVVKAEAKYAVNNQAKFKVLETMDEAIDERREEIASESTEQQPLW
jgi:hypothetical protein